MKLFIFSFFLIISCLFCGKITEPNNSSGWNLQFDNNDNITYYAIHFADEKNGWIVGYSGTIKKTSDGGDNWESQLSGVQSNLWDVCFINNKIGWVCGADNTILKTADSGETWNKIFLPDNTEKINVSIQFIDENNGCVSNNNGEILKSDDGGMNWQVVKYNNIGGARIAIFDESTVYFLSGKLFRTYDSGLTWDSLLVSTPNNYMNNEMFFCNPNCGYITTANGTGGMMISEYPIMRTTNGGSTWQASEYLKSESNGLRCVFFTDEKNGWVAGSNIYKTDNGGESWNLDYSSKTGTLGSKNMYFIDEKIGWLINWDGQIYKYVSN